MQGAFMSVSKSVVACVLGLAMTTGGAALAQTGDDPALKNMNACLSGNNPGSEAAFMTNLNPALNDPDRVAWCLFLYVNTNAATSGNNNALFETWASDNDTFQTNPVWPGPGSGDEPKPETRKIFNAERKALQVMGLGPDATLEVVKAKYKALVKQHHPDANGGDRSTEDRLIEIIKAYNYLKTVVRGAT